MTATGAIAVWIAARSPGSHIPIWPAYALSAVAVIALYMTFASLFGIWPATLSRRHPSADPELAVNAAQGPPEPPPFELRYYPRKASLAGGWVTSHYVRVTNPAGQPERRVHMTAELMSPYPRRKSAVGTDPAFPHIVPPESGGTPAAGLVIGPGQEQSWFIGNTWLRPDGKISVCDFFSDTSEDWEPGPDERWRICYRITCDGVPGVPFSIVITTEEGQAVVRLEGLAGRQRVPLARVAGSRPWNRRVPWNHVGGPHHWRPSA